jgi:predicted ATPase
MKRVLCSILIGRDEELSRLEDTLLSANRGEGQVLVLAGDAGMGKTRLASELGEWALRQGDDRRNLGCRS